MDDSTAPFFENHIPSPLDIIPGSVVRIPANTPAGGDSFQGPIVHITTRD